MTVILESTADFTLNAYRQVAWQGEAVRLGDQAVATIAQARQGFLDLLAADPEQFIYGVTTGYGESAKHRLDAEGRRRQAQAPPYHAGIGLGPPLPARLVRGIIFARLTNFVSGHGAVSPAIAESVVQMLDGRSLPELPIRGQMSSGEVDALVGLFHHLIGAGCAEKDASSLLNGAPVSAAMTADAALRAERRLSLLESVLALSIEAVRAPLDAYDPALAVLWQDEDLTQSLAALGRLLDRTDPNDRRSFQAPVCWRATPQVLARVRRTTRDLQNLAEGNLRRVTDNPAYLAPDAAHPQGRVLSNAGFHSSSAVPALDSLAFCWADLTSLSSRQIERLLDPALQGQPGGLAKAGSPFGVRRLASMHAWFRQRAQEGATATLTPLDDLSNDQSDISLPIFVAYEKETDLAGHLDVCLAILAAVVSQSLWIAERQPAPPLRPFLESLRETFPPVESKRQLGHEIEGLAQVFSAATLGATDLPLPGDTR